MLRIPKGWRLVLILLAGTAILIGGGKLWHLWRFPYGWSHSCDKQLMSALRQYAENHHGVYPAGEKTPEASLSLLYPEYANEHVLHGKTMPVEIVKATLERGERLGPETCGWHYVEGLRISDDRRIAIFWDKVGLGHFGDRLPDGGHLVHFLDMDSKYIPGSEWDHFLEEQMKLLVEQAERRR